MMKLRIDGKVCAKQRPKFWQGHAVTPEQTVNYETLIKWTYAQNYPHKQPSKKAICMTLEIYLAIPMSTPKKNIGKMLMDLILPKKKPDVDNVVKIVCDALNKVAYLDDKQITDLHVRKRYNEAEYLLIILEELDDE